MSLRVVSVRISDMAKHSLQLLETSVYLCANIPFILSDCNSRFQILQRGNHVMPKNNMATIHIKTSDGLRNRVLGQLRARGTTMQEFMEDVLYLTNTNSSFFAEVEELRAALPPRESIPDLQRVS